MDWVIWLVVGIVLVLTTVFFSIRTGLDRRARRMKGADPEMAAALRDIRGQIDKGSMYR